MAGSVNKVILIGNLGRDPEIRQLPSGGRVANLSLATSETWRDKGSGEKREKTEWHRITIFSDGLANICEQYLRKGSKIYVEGQLETRKWNDNDGNDRYTTEIVLRNYNSALQMLDGKNTGGAGNTAYDGPGAQLEQDGQPENFSRDIDDDIPF